MGIIKKMLKRTRIYTFFDKRFVDINNNNKEIVLESEKRIKDYIKQENEILKQDIQRLNEEIYNKIDEYISTGLLQLLVLNNSQQKILIVGFYGAPNSGDELMLQSLLQKIDTTKYSITIMLADNPKYKIENYKNVNFIHYPKTNMDINILANFFDKIIFGGGALLEDNEYGNDNAYKTNTATILIDLSIAGILNGKKVYCVGLSAAKVLTNVVYISKLEYIIEKSEYFSLRDKNSLETLRKCGIENFGKIAIIKDLAFSLPDIKYNPKKMEDCEKFVIGLVLINVNNQEKLKNIILLIDQYFKNLNKKIEIRLIPFYDFQKADIVQYGEIIKDIKTESEIKIIPYYQRYQDIAEEFCKCNIMVNMRYHSTLLSLKLTIPSLNIIYDVHSHYENKMQDLKEKYSLADTFMSYKTLDDEIFIKKLEYVVKNITKLNLQESIVSKRLEKEAIQEHIKLINDILK